MSRIDFRISKGFPELGADSGQTDRQTGRRYAICNKAFYREDRVISFVQSLLSVAAAVRRLSFDFGVIQFQYPGRRRYLAGNSAPCGQCAPLPLRCRRRTQSHTDGPRVTRATDRCTTNPQGTLQHRLNVVHLIYIKRQRRRITVSLPENESHSGPIKSGLRVPGLCRPNSLLGSADRLSLSDVRPVYIAVTVGFHDARQKIVKYVWFLTLVKHRRRHCWLITSFGTTDNTACVEGCSWMHWW